MIAAVQVLYVAAGVAAAGLFLRWAVIPVHAAYEVGKRIERIRQRR